MEQENQLLESNTSELVLAVSSAEIATWSEDKKTQFVGTFKDRVSVARYILESTAMHIGQTALRRQFIGERHLRKIFESGSLDLSRFTKLSLDYRSYHQPQPLIGGRTLSDLTELAVQRAETVLNSLPPMQKALAIIDPETAKMMDRIAALKAQGVALVDQVEEASQPILAAEQDQNMTLGAFRDMVKARDKHRKALIEKLNEVGKKGSELEVIVTRKLFKGLPGLCDAVVDVMQVHMDRSKALDTMSRRVEEQVKFGDSDAALDLLRHFEKDEVEVSASVKSSFDAALEKLKVAVRKGRVTKALLGKKEQHT